MNFQCCLSSDLKRNANPFITVTWKLSNIGSVPSFDRILERKSVLDPKNSELGPIKKKKKKSLMHVFAVRTACRPSGPRTWTVRNVRMVQNLNGSVVWTVLRSRTIHIPSGTGPSKKRGTGPSQCYRLVLTL